MEWHRIVDDPLDWGDRVIRKGERVVDSILGGVDTLVNGSQSIVKAVACGCDEYVHKHEPRLAQEIAQISQSYGKSLQKGRKIFEELSVPEGYENDLPEWYTKSLAIKKAEVKEKETPAPEPEPEQPSE